MKNKYGKKEMLSTDRMENVENVNLEDGKFPPFNITSSFYFIAFHSGPKYIFWTVFGHYIFKILNSSQCPSECSPIHNWVIYMKIKTYMNIYMKV